MLKNRLIKHTKKEELKRKNKAIKAMTQNSKFFSSADEVVKALEEGLNLDTVYLDFSKAFDKWVIPYESSERNRIFFWTFDQKRQKFLIF